MPSSGRPTPTDGPPPPATLPDLLNDIMERNGYRNLSELARHTTVPYKTLWAWSNGTRNTKRPPAVTVLRKFAEDLRLPESVVFRAAGRAYTDPGALDEEAVELLNRYKELPVEDQSRVLRIVTLFRTMTPEQRKIAENVVRGVAAADGPVTVG